jgi:putative transposase
MYLTNQRFTAKAVASQVRQTCELLALKTSPHPNTVRNRIRALNAQMVARRRQGPRAADKLNAHPGVYDEAKWPLAVIQIDHTSLDVILVDDTHRQPIGRPWITMAIDVYSRMVTGYYVSLDPTGNLSTGMCIAHSILPKDKWLEQHGIAGHWPCWGFMDRIHTDNAKEFRGHMILRACQEYGIDLQFRPVRQPRYGGHIERLLGTLLKKTHELPGTTFSNTSERGEYDAEGQACFTFAEFEVWLAKCIVEVINQDFHRGIGTSPVRRYEEAMFGPHRLRPLPDTITKERELRLAFMPFEERTIQQTGVVIDDIHYFHDILRPFINAHSPGHSRSRKFTFKRDPRDISVIYFYDSENKEYREIPYRDLSRGPASIWEIRAARRKLLEEGRRNIDESLLFEKANQMRELASQAAQKTNAARRAAQRVSNQRKIGGKAKDAQLSQSTEGSLAAQQSPVYLMDDKPVEPFDEVEVQ